MESMNYFDKVPVRDNNIKWETDNENIVTLQIENRGIFNRIAQIILKKPKVSYIHLDKTSSFLWLLIDGKTDIEEIAKKVDICFGEKVYPLYERLIKYFIILESYNFIKWK